MFAWSYEDLKSYDIEIIQHKIPLKENQKPYRQKLRRINPVQLPLVEKEIIKMYDDGIIVPVRYIEWVSNLVSVRNKTGEIRLFIDFINLNKAFLKDNYPLPKMDHILQRVVGSKRISLLDGFSGYNQVPVHPDDQHKTTFTTPWGTFMYVKNALWFNECWWNISEIHGYCILGRIGLLHHYLPWWCHCFFLRQMKST